MNQIDARAVEDALDDLMVDARPFGSADALDRILRRAGLAIGRAATVDFGDEVLTQRHIDDAVEAQLSKQRIAAVDTVVSLFLERLDEDMEPVSAIVSIRTGERIADAVSLDDMRGCIAAARDDYVEMEHGDD